VPRSSRPHDRAEPIVCENLPLVRWSRAVIISPRRSRRAEAIAVAAVSALVLCVTAFTASRHHDEDQNGWGGSYVTHELLHLDFSWSGGTFVDPKWDPTIYWNFTQPVGVRWLQGFTMRIAGLEPPRRPYSYTDETLQGPETLVPTTTLHVLRVLSALLAAAGLGLLWLRFRWKALPGAVLLLVTPAFRDDLGRAWSEGPLLFMFGLCAATFGRRAFAPVAGLAAAVKLTAVGLWPLLLLRRASGTLRRAAAVVITLLVWTLVNPQSWVRGGPPYLVTMWHDRYHEWAGQSETYGGPLGAFFPSRYQWPVELGLTLLLAFGAEQLLRRRRTQRIARLALPETRRS
jgi:hypothetical protein